MKSNPTCGSTFSSLLFYETEVGECHGGVASKRYISGNPLVIEEAHFTIEFKVCDM